MSNNNHFHKQTFHNISATTKAFIAKLLIDGKLYTQTIIKSLFTLITSRPTDTEDLHFQKELLARMLVLSLLLGWTVAVFFFQKKKVDKRDGFDTETT